MSRTVRYWRSPTFICACCRRQFCTARCFRLADNGETRSELFRGGDPGPGPTREQLECADRFFNSANKTFLMSTPRFRDLPPSDIPEVAFLGRSNVGKSSLLNAVFASTAQKGREGRQELARTSKKAGRTRELCAFAVGNYLVRNRGHRGHARDEQGAPRYESWAQGRGPSVVVLDTPGYGAASRAEWGKQIVNYLHSRKQLRRTFVLVDAEHGLKDTDKSVLRLLGSSGIAHQLVLTKFDKILFPKSKSIERPNPERVSEAKQRMSQILVEAEEYGKYVLAREVLGCSGETTFPQGTDKKAGISELRFTIMGITGQSSYVDASVHGMVE